MLQPRSATRLPSHGVPRSTESRCGTDRRQQTASERLVGRRRRARAIETAPEPNWTSSSVAHNTLSIMRSVLAAVLLAGLVTAAAQAPRPPGVTMVERKVNVLNMGGELIQTFTLRNVAGMEVSAMTYGAIITSWKAPDRSGQMADIVLGSDEPGSISQGGFPRTLARRRPIRQPDRECAGLRWTAGPSTLATNDGINHLHGGRQGFRQGRLGWPRSSGTPRIRARREIHLHQRRRRRRLSRTI